MWNRRPPAANVQVRQADPRGEQKVFSSSLEPKGVLMHIQPRGTWLAIAVVALVACQGGSQEAAVSEVDPAVEAAAIMALEREWSAKFQEKDLEWIVNLHATNGRQFPPNAEAVVGRDALRAQWEAMFDLDASWESAQAHVSESGDMAYDFGAATINTPEGPIPSKYLVVWVREDGEWKVAVDMFSPNQPE
jgi:ketosteroid isomerase-like protein